jgi:ABC-type Mn2+/Zn2+ transport system ATPase subunit
VSTRVPSWGSLGLDEIRRAGKTILLFSHSLGTVKQLYSWCLLMNQGSDDDDAGETEKVLEEYSSVSQGKRGVQPKDLTVKKQDNHVIYLKSEKLLK